MSTSRLRLLSTFAITLGILAILVCYIRNHWDQVRSFERLTVVQFASVVVLVTLQAILRSFGVSLAFHGLGRRVGTMACFWTSILANLVNHALPLQTGAAIRAHYLKRNFGVEYSKFASALIAVQLLSLILTSSIACVGLFFLGRSVATVMGLLVALSIILGATGVLFSSLLRNALSLWIPRFAVVWDGMQFFGRHKRIFVAELVIQLLLRFAEGFTFWFAAKSLGLDSSLVDSIILTSIVGISSVVTLTPNNIGINESLYAAFASTVNLSPVQCLSIGLMIRAITFVRSAILSPVAFLILQRYSFAAGGRRDATSATE